jgi:hypothetical protein
VSGFEASGSRGDLESPPAEAPADPPDTAPRRRQSYFSSDSDEPVESPIDALFAETHFKDYEGEPLVGPIPDELNPFSSPAAAAASSSSAETAASSANTTPTVSERISRARQSLSRPSRAGRSGGTAPRGPHEPFSKNQKILFWVAGAVIAILLLAVLFAIGTRLAQRTTSQPVVATTKSASATPTPTPTPTPTGAAAVGVHKWGDLRGGECVDPFTTPFAEKFTVVDCAAAHPAQMVARGTFPAAPAAYPGLEALQSQINLLCTAPGVIDLAAAGAYTDIQVQAAYAASAAEWKDGQHDYFCFVNRAGGDTITGTVAGTPAK